MSTQPPVKVTQPALSSKTASSIPARKLSPPPDLNDPAWPVCIDESLIIRKDADETEKRFRALQITGIMGVEYAGKKVLDFGCGEGHVAAEIGHSASSVIGFDPKTCPGWAGKQTATIKFVSSMDEVSTAGTFDLILLYDVIDHLEGVDPGAVIQDLAGLLRDDGIMHCRCHPWTSRHGGHLYEQKNLAYLHLLLTTAELVETGIKVEPNLKITKPLALYEGWFKAAGLAIDKKKVVTETPPEFVMQHIDRIIDINWAGNIEPAVAAKIMSNQFLDYTLVRR